MNYNPFKTVSMERQTSETIPDAAESLTDKVVTPLPGFGPAAPWTCSFCWPSLIWWSSCCWRGAALSACLLRLAWISVLRPHRCCCHGRWLLTGALAWHWRSRSHHKCWSVGHCRHQICTHLRRWHTHCCWWSGVVTHSTFLLSNITIKKPSKTFFCKTDPYSFLAESSFMEIWNSHWLQAIHSPSKILLAISLNGSS